MFFFCDHVSDLQVVLRDNNLVPVLALKIKWVATLFKIIYILIGKNIPSLLQTEKCGIRSNEWIPLTKSSLQNSL